MATVATDVGGVAEATGDAGLVVPPQSPELTAEACLRLLTDTEYRRSMGRAARARVLAKFTLEQNLAAYGDLYRAVGRHVPAAPRPADTSRSPPAPRR